MSLVPFVPASDQNMARIAEALESTSGDPSIAESYDNTATYNIGKCVKHDGILYKCTTAITTPEPWTAAHWREVKLANEVLEIKEKIGNTNLPTTAQTVTGAIAEQNDNITKLEEGIAIIVDGDTASIAVPAGSYAYIKNNTHGLLEGMYKNTSLSTFPVSGGTADNTVFTTVPTGAVNDAVSMVNLGVLSDMASLISAISTLESSLENNTTRFVKFNTNVATDYWLQWEYHTGIVQKDDLNNWTAVFAGTSGETLSVGSLGSYYSSREEKNRISTLYETGIDFYGFTIGQAKAIIAKPFTRVGIAFGIWSTTPASLKIIPFWVTIPANATSLTIPSVRLYDQGEVTSGSYDVVILTFRAN